MTKQKDLKRKIRARAEKTGEPYTTARAAMLKEKAEPFKTLDDVLLSEKLAANAKAKLAAAAADPEHANEHLNTTPEQRQKIANEVLQEALKADDALFEGGRQPDNYPGNCPLCNKLSCEPGCPNEDNALPCIKCGQIDNGQTGEYPCSACGVPTVWDGRVEGKIKEAVRGTDPEYAERVAKDPHSPFARESMDSTWKRAVAYLKKRGADPEALLKLAEENFKRWEAMTPEQRALVLDVGDEDVSVDTMTLEEQRRAYETIRVEARKAKAVALGVRLLRSDIEALTPLQRTDTSALMLVERFNKLLNEAKGLRLWRSTDTRLWPLPVMGPVRSVELDTYVRQFAALLEPVEAVRGRTEHAVYLDDANYFDEEAPVDLDAMRSLRFNPRADGNNKDFFGRGFERLPCGHLVTDPDSVQSKTTLEDLRAFHGIDGEKELRAAVSHERAQHTSGECLKPGWALKPVTTMERDPNAPLSEQIGYIEPQSFKLVRLSPMACGHKVREDTEIPIDLRALWGSEGVAAFEAIMEGEREKHRTGRCAESLGDLKLAPVYDRREKRLTMVLTDARGHILYPTRPDFDAVPDGSTVVSIDSTGMTREEAIRVVDSSKPDPAVLGKVQGVWSAALNSPDVRQKLGKVTGADLTEAEAALIADMPPFAHPVELKVNGRSLMASRASPLSYEAVVLASGLPDRAAPYWVEWKAQDGERGRMKPGHFLGALPGTEVTVKAEVVVDVNGYKHPVTPGLMLSYEQIERWVADDDNRPLGAGGLLSIVWSVRNGPSGTLYGTKTVEVLDGMRITAINTGNA